MKIHRKTMEIRWMKYRPKPRKVVEVLLRRFCRKCLRAWSIGRGFKLIRSKCLGCPVFEAICTIDPKLKSRRKELEDLKRKYGLKISI